MGLLSLMGYRGSAEILGQLRIVSFDDRTGLTIEGVTLAECNAIVNALATDSVPAVKPGNKFGKTDADKVLATGNGAEPAFPKKAPGGTQQPAAAAPAAAPPKETKPAEAPTEAPTEAPPEEAGGNFARWSVDRRMKTEDLYKAGDTTLAEIAVVVKMDVEKVEAYLKKKGYLKDKAGDPDPETTAQNNVFSGEGEDEPKGDPENEGKGDPNDLVEALGGDDADEFTGDGQPTTKKANGTGDFDPEMLEELKLQKKLRDVLGILADKGYDTQAKLLNACTTLKDTVPLLGRVASLEDRVPRIATSIGIDE